MREKDKLVLIGYSGHGYVAAETIIAEDDEITGYCDREKKDLNPYGLRYLGSEEREEVLQVIGEYAFHIGIGDNNIREKVFLRLSKLSQARFHTAVHPSAVIASTAEVGTGVLIAAGAIVNPLASIGKGVICNTGSIIEHECRVEDFAHIAPGAVLAGNVTVGKKSFIGANAVIKQGVTIGKKVTVGAGSVILRNIPDGAVVVGNPGRPLVNRKFKK